MKEKVQEHYKTKEDKNIYKLTNEIKMYKFLNNDFGTEKCNYIIVKLSCLVANYNCY